jgi:co-chaperonin GroES (HSP10)
MNHTPTHDWIVVQVTTLTGTMPLVRGVFQPGADVPPKKYGTVIAVGPGRFTAASHLIPLPCRVGDTVMVRAVAGDKVVVDGQEYLWCFPDEVLAVVVPPAS